MFLILPESFSWLSDLIPHLTTTIATRPVVGIVLILSAVCLTRWCYKALVFRSHNTSDKPTQSLSQTPTPTPPPTEPTLPSIFPAMPHHRPLPSVQILEATTPTSPRSRRYSRRVRSTKKDIIPTIPVSPPVPTTEQPYDVFLVLDVEATCHQGTNFDYPNEIIVRVTSKIILCVPL